MLESVEYNAELLISRFPPYCGSCPKATDSRAFLPPLGCQHPKSHYSNPSEEGMFPGMLSALRFVERAANYWHV